MMHETINSARPMMASDNNERGLDPLGPTGTSMASNLKGADDRASLLRIDDGDGDPLR
jgi:hypothetical protein